MNLLRPLRQRHLATLWGSQVLSSMGDHLYDLAVIWTAIQVAGSGAGIVAATNTLARLVCGLLGGVYADRWNRRRGDDRGGRDPGGRGGGVAAAGTRRASRVVASRGGIGGARRAR